MLGSIKITVVGVILSLLIGCSTFQTGYGQVNDLKEEVAEGMLYTSEVTLKDAVWYIIYGARSGVIDDYFGKDPELADLYNKLKEKLKEVEGADMVNISPVSKENSN